MTETTITAMPTPTAVAEVVIAFVHYEVDNALGYQDWQAHYDNEVECWIEVGISAGRSWGWVESLAIRLMETNIPLDREAERSKAYWAIHSGEGEYIALAKAHIDGASRLIDAEIALRNAIARA